MARENPGWGYTRIHGALVNLDIKVGRGTIRRILKEHLIEPAPARGRRVPWSVFLKAHWKAVGASDFFTVEVWSWRGLITHYILFVIDLATRRVVIAGITTNAESDGCRDQNAPRYAALDRRSGYEIFHRVPGVSRPRGRGSDSATAAVTELECIRRTVRQIRKERMSIETDSDRCSHAPPRGARVYGALSSRATHQGLRNQLIVPLRIPRSRSEPVGRRTRLGGMLSYYERAAA
jgi:putative transposase